MAYNAQAKVSCLLTLIIEFTNKPNLAINFSHCQHQLIMTHIEQLIWSMLEDMGIDLENDNDKAEICDKYIDHIKDKIEKGYVNYLFKGN